MKILLGLLWLVHWLPLWILSPFGEAVGVLLFHVMTPRRNITLTNLRLCFPDMSEAERHKLARRHFQAYARSSIERAVLWWASEARLKRLITFETTVDLEQFAQKPTILLCPHFVCLELIGIAMVLNSSCSACTIYAKQRNAVIDQALINGRSRFRPVRLFTRQEGIKPIIRAMREGIPFYMFPDMDFGNKDAEFVPFFGIPAATLTAPARLAAATRGVVIPSVARFKPRYKGWHVVFYPPLEDFPGDDITAATQRMNSFIEKRILECPEQYFWAHKRFKTRPEGMPPLYRREDSEST